MPAPSPPPPPRPSTPVPTRQPAPQVRGRLVPASRPHLFDFLLILLGVSISMYLAALSGLRALPAEGEASEFGLKLAQAAPLLLFVPVGMVLFGPVFYILQRLVGRTQGLSLGEWLWSAAWLASCLWTSWIVWKASGDAPDGLTSEDFKRVAFGLFVVYLLCMGLVALGAWIYGLFSDRLHPWTHFFGLALLLWPLAPLALIKIIGLRMEFS